MNDQETTIAIDDFSEARNVVVTKFEIDYVVRRLEERVGNVTAAAKLSGMTRQNFQRLMKKHKIRAERYRNSRQNSQTPNADTK